MVFSSDSQPQDATHQAQRPALWIGSSQTIAVTAFVVTAMVFLWILFRHRDWPAISSADLGGIGILCLTLYAVHAARKQWVAADSPAAAPSLLELLLRWLPLATAVALIGHVSTLAAFSLLVVAAFAVALTWEPILARFRREVLPRFRDIQSSCLALFSPNATAQTSTPFPNVRTTRSNDSHSTLPSSRSSQPVARNQGESLATTDHLLTERSSLAPTSRSQASDSVALLDESDEETSVDEDEVEERLDASRPMQSWERFVDPQGGESIQGEATLRFETGQLLQWLHLPCWPPLPSPPQIELHPWDEDVRAKPAQVERHGVRIEVRLASPADRPRETRLSFEMTATHPPSQLLPPDRST